MDRRYDARLEIIENIGDPIDVGEQDSVVNSEVRISYEQNANLRVADAGRMQRHVLGDGVVLALGAAREEFERCLPVGQTVPVLPGRYIRIAIDETIDGFELCHQR